MRSTAIFPLASKIGGRVSGNMQSRALAAIVVSLVAMIVYLWLRFAKPSYGIAAGVALIHDVLITVGMLASAHTSSQRCQPWHSFCASKRSRSI